MRRRPKLQLYLAKLILSGSLLAPTQAQAWGPEGHEVIATVARDRLAARNPAAANRIYAILKADNLLAVYTPPPSHKNPHPREQRCSARTIASLANWPDCVRKLTRYAYTARLHFDDVPRCPQSDALPDKSIYCKNGKCGSAALPGYIATLKDKHATPRAQSEALSFLIHFVGDLHQPMHAVENGNDRGGNDVSVRIGAKETNLHSLWDGTLVSASVGSTPEAIARIRQLADANATAWAGSEPDAWVLQSHLLAEPAYSGLSKPPACKIGKTDGGLVSADYVAAAKPVIEQQLAAAAIRLTDILEDALAGN